MACKPSRGLQDVGEFIYIKNLYKLKIKSKRGDNKLLISNIVLSNKKIFPYLLFLTLVSFTGAGNALEFRDTQTNDRSFNFTDGSSIGSPGYQPEIPTSGFEHIFRDQRLIQIRNGEIVVLDARKSSCKFPNPCPKIAEARVCNSMFTNQSEYMKQYCLSSGQTNTATLLKSKFGTKELIEVCDSLRNDPSQTPKAYYHRQFKEFWTIDIDEKIEIFGISAALWSLPVGDDPPQECVVNDSTTSLRQLKRSNRENELKQLALKAENIKKIEDSKKNQLIRKTLAMRKSPWSAFEHFATVNGDDNYKYHEFYFDNKSIYRKNNISTVLVLQEDYRGKFFDSSAVIYDMNCANESFRWSGIVLFEKPIQAEKISEVKLNNENDWHYVERNTEIQLLFKRICM